MSDPVARIDAQGGRIEAIKLTANDDRKALLRIRRGGVLVEMALSPAEVTAFAVELQEVIDWVADETMSAG